MALTPYGNSDGSDQPVHSLIMALFVSQNTAVSRIL